MLDIKKVVLETLILSEEPLKSGDIAEKCGIEKVQVDKAIKQLMAEEKVFSPKRCFYDAK
jgi:predicted transcriptional regulator